jgi:hypothetical protein
MHPEFMRAAVAGRVQDLMGSRTPRLGHRRKFGRASDVGVHRGGIGIRWLGRGHRKPPTRRRALNVIDPRC